MLTKKNIQLFTILFLFIALFTTNVKGQNYALFNANKNMTFTKRDTNDIDSAYFFAKIDSIVSFGSDSIYYFNHYFDTISIDPCSAINGLPVMLGNKMIKRDDAVGSHIFINNNGDSIYLRNKIAVGNTWHVYTWPDGSYVKATVINHIPFSPLPLTPDTIYRIQLNVFTLGGIAVPDSFPNQTKIDLAKEHGLIEFFDFRTFPSPGDSLQFLLRGLTNPYEYKSDVDAEKAFTYETGYEFHYREETVPDTISGADKKISAWKFFVMAKTETETSATYTMERILFDTLYFDGAPSANIIWDTVTITYTFADYAFLDTLELNLFQSTKFGYSDWFLEDSLFKGVALKYVYDWFDYDSGTGCLSNPDNITQPEQLYGDGLGLMHYIDSTDAAEYYKFDMVYFHKGLKEWGTPYDFSGLDLEIKENQLANSISIYPNPAHENIYFHNDIQEEMDANIYSMDGKLLISKHINPSTSNIVISISDIPKGYYIIKINTTTEQRFGKFIKD